MHIQNERPQFTPGFLVSMVLHGSSCSHLGAMGFVKSFPQECLDASRLASSTFDMSFVSWEGTGGVTCALGESEADFSVGIRKASLIDMAARVGNGGSSLVGSSAISLAPSKSLAGNDLALKKPLRLCCPLLAPFVVADCDPDLGRLAADAAGSKVRVLFSPTVRAGLRVGAAGILAVCFRPSREEA